MGSENGKMAVNLGFPPEVVLFPPEVSWFFKFSKLHLSILAKSLENLTFFGSKCPKFQFLGKSTGSRPISAGSQLIFQVFKVFWQKVWKIGQFSLKNPPETEMACPEMLKNLNFSKNHALFNKKFEKYKVFLTKLPETEVKCFKTFNFG